MHGSDWGNEATMRSERVLARPVLPGFVEYCYFGLLFYGLFGEAWGLSIPLLGAGGMAVLAMYCVWQNGTFILKPISLPLGCAISFLIIQIVIHDGSPMDDGLRVFVIWILSLIIVQSLCLREGFFHRFAFAASVIGASCLPYLVNYGNENDPFERVGL